MQLNNKSYLNEEQKEQKKAYDNYILGIKRLSSFKSTIYQNLLQNLESESFLKLNFGEFYYKQYIIEIYNNLPVFEGLILKYIDDNKVTNDDKKMLLFYKDKAEKKVFELYTNIETTSKKTNNISKVTLEDFLNDKITSDKILEIQKAFKNETGKQMAILIHFLKTFDLIKFDNNDRKRTSRIHFVRCFTNNKELRQINSINNYLDIDENLKKIGKDDKQYIRIENQLKKIVINC